MDKNDRYDRGDVADAADKVGWLRCIPVSNVDIYQQFEPQITPWVITLVWASPRKVDSKWVEVLEKVYIDGRDRTEQYLIEEDVTGGILWWTMDLALAREAGDEWRPRK